MTKVTARTDDGRLSRNSDCKCPITHGRRRGLLPGVQYRGFGDGSTPVGFRGKALVGGLGRSPQKLKHIAFLQETFGQACS